MEHRQTRVYAIVYKKGYLGSGNPTQLRFAALCLEDQEIELLHSTLYEYSPMISPHGCSLDLAVSNTLDGAVSEVLLSYMAELGLRPAPAGQRIDTYLQAVDPRGGVREIGKFLEAETLLYKDLMVPLGAGWLEERFSFVTLSSRPGVVGASAKRAAETIDARLRLHPLELRRAPQTKC